MFCESGKLISLIITVGVIIVGCSVSVPQGDRLSEVEQLYDQQQYQNAMSVARYNLNKKSSDLASITTVWKVQLVQGGKSIDYAQQFYLQAKERIIEKGAELIPFMGKALLKDPYNTVRLFCLYALAEFEDSLSTHYLVQVFDPGFTLGSKSSDVTLEFLRSEAAMALANHGYTDIYDQVVELANSQDPEIQAKAVTVLALVGGEKAIPVLEEISRQAHGKADTDWVGELADSTVARLKRGE
ncbi:MAG: HEAT repeat domain-containing protein [Candidatus Glassbacteria bacterium]|nr:HEAT repeat domain-containing protein [Candidatus Glassbacteria bacterium]